MTRMQQVAENAAVYGIWTGIVLILLTPFVVTPDTIFPFVVGKAVYSRSLIECVFGIWAILALFRPAYRPPRSWLLLLLAVNVGVSVLAACFGVSPQRSFWSTYERMQGVVDLIHWFAFAVVLASVLRTERDWRIVLNLNLGASLTVAALSICLYYSIDIRFFDYFYTDWGEDRQAGIDPLGRISASLGNPLYLGAYGLLNGLVAAGFLVQSSISAAPASSIDSSVLEREDHTPSIKRRFWTWTMIFNLWTISLSGSRGVLLSLLASGGGLTVAALLLGQTRLYRFVAVGVLGFLVCMIALVLFLTLRPTVFMTNGPFEIFKPGAASVETFVNPLLKRLLRPEMNGKEGENPQSQRISMIAIGLRGFAERPFLGWGPDNFIITFGRYAPKNRGDDEILDQSHNKIVEELVTKGILGLLSYLALWIYLFRLVVQVFKSSDVRCYILPLFVFAALTGHFTQSLLSVDNSLVSLQYILLLVFVTRLEAAGEKPAAARRLRTHLPYGMRVAIAGGILILVGTGLFRNQAIYSAACMIKKAIVSADNSSQAIDFLKQATTQFRPLANTARNLLFSNGPGFWNVLRVRHQPEADRLLLFMEDEAALALATEPENWLIWSNLAKMYGAIAVYHSEYYDLARRHSERALELAPHRREAISSSPRTVG